MPRAYHALRIAVVCTAMMLCLAEAGAAISSSVSKSKAHSPVARKMPAGSSAHKAASAGARQTGTSRVAAAKKKVPVKSAGAVHPASRASRGANAASRGTVTNARARNVAHAAPAVLRTNLHHRITPGERKLAHLREVNFQARHRTRIEVETQESSGLIEQPPSSRRFEFALSMPAPLRGSHESLLRQNTKSDDEGLERILNDDDLNDRIAEGLLVPVPTTLSLLVNSSLPANRRYCRPWTANFLTDLARAHASEFTAPLMVTSAVRTVEFQRKLIETNGNAAPAEGDLASPHLTGGAIDIAKSQMSKKEIAWMRRWLMPLQEAGQIDVEEEFKQACFHITVYDTYVAISQPMPKAKKRRPVRTEAANAGPSARGE